MLQAAAVKSSKVFPMPSQNGGQAPVQTFSSLLVNNFRSIIEESSRDLQYVRETPYNAETKEKFHAVLDQGIWYPEEYYKALQKCNKTARLEWMKENDCQRFRRCSLSTHSFSRLSPTAFRIKDAILPSAALASIGKKMNFLDCSSIYTLAFFRALEEFIGVQKFDHLFAWDSSTPFTFAADMHYSAASFLFDPVDIGNLGDLQSGDKCYFSNIHGYEERHPLGHAAGYSVLYTNLQHPFLGFGLSQNGLSKEGVEQALFTSYNQDPLVETTQKKSKGSTITWEEFQRQKGSSPLPKNGKFSRRVFRPNSGRIESLAKAPLEKIRDVYVKMAHKNY
ncbi:MAG: hypothetical protein ABSA17_03595 [Rhabdochlamydiaceae bacterium]|jgi:hypothetical protein